MNQSTAKVRPSKPAQLTADFPPFPHATRRWPKKIRANLHYFGPRDDPDAALDWCLAEKDYLHVGRRHPSTLTG